MIGFIEGEIIEKIDGKLLLLTKGGIGYVVAVPTSVLADTKNGSPIRLYTYLKVSEQALDLYGFKSRSEKALFELVISISGVGPRIGLAILSSGSVEHIKNAIGSGNTSFFFAISGIGKRTAERIVIELKEKVGITGIASSLEESTITGPVQEAIDGLKAMGYTSLEVQEMMHGVETVGLSIQEILKKALANK